MIVLIQWTNSPFKELPKPYYKILFENDDVRIVEHKLEPGESEPLHSHPPMIVYFLEDAEVWVAGPDGKSRKEILKKGQTLNPPSITHSIQNKGTSALHSLLVELKE